MKRAFVVLGLVLLAIGIFFAYDSSTLGAGLGALGFSQTQTVVDRNVLVQVSPSKNYTSSIGVPMSPQDTLTLSFKTSPGRVDFFLMNQGNYSLFSAKNGSAYAVYPQSQLNVSLYSLTFNESGYDGILYLVFVSHDVQADVLTHLTVSRAVNSAAVEYLPLGLALVGLVIVAFGLFLSSPRPRAAPKSGPNVLRCKFCGAPLGSGQSAFCPSCGRAQQ